jgi:hypothetical protein
MPLPTETVKISELPSLPAPSAGDNIPVSQSGTTYKASPADFATDWKDLPVLPTASDITHLGNRVYRIIFPAVDYSSVLSSDMRLRLERTVSAPTQSASANGTTQYYSKASPTGMGQTDDITVSIWIKPGAYVDSDLISRFNGTSGWELRMTGTGQIAFVGYNAGAANFSQVQSYQSVPLNEWTHITAQLDMSAFTNSPTTSYIMFNAADVPCAVSRGGTNPSALVAAGDFNIGAVNNGTRPFFGKLAQPAVYNAKVTQATIRGYMSQGLVGNETSTISAYSLSNSITDLNGGTNNLTANGSLVATNGDSPFGGQADSTISAVFEYAKILSVASGIVTVQASDISMLPTTGGVAAVSYSSAYRPHGYPGDPTLGYSEVRSNFAYTSTSDVDYPGMVINPYIPSGGKKIQITAAVIRGVSTNSGGNAINLIVKEGSNIITTSTANTTNNETTSVQPAVAEFYATPGSHSYKVSVSSNIATSVTLNAAATSASYISAKVLN